MSQSAPITKTVSLPDDPQGAPITKSVALPGATQGAPITKSVSLPGGAQSAALTLQVANIRGDLLAAFRRKFIAGRDLAAMTHDYPQGSIMPSTPSAMNATGILSDLTELAPGGQGISSGNDGPSSNFNTGGVLNNEAGIDTHQASGFGLVTMPGAPQVMCKFHVGFTGDIRLFVGLTDIAISTMLASDDPVGDYIGLQFSTARGDTTWQFARRNGGAQVLIDTGITPVASSPVYLELESRGAADVTLKLRNSSRKIVRQDIITTSLPNTTLRFMAALRTLAVVNKDINIYHAHLAVAV